MPLFDGEQNVIGIMGYVRPYHGGIGGGTDSPQVARVVAHIHKKFRERLKIAELARIAHLSERQLNRRFQEIFHMAPRDFITRTRIQAASDALLESDKPICDIAQECGFSDQSSFTKLFGSHLGESPLMFRRRRRPTRSQA